MLLTNRIEYIFQYAIQFHLPNTSEKHLVYAKIIFNFFLNPTIQFINERVMIGYPIIIIKEIWCYFFLVIFVLAN